MLPNRFPTPARRPSTTPSTPRSGSSKPSRATSRAPATAAFVRDDSTLCCADIVDWHVRGTRYGIRVDADGLLPPASRECNSPGWTPRSAIGWSRRATASQSRSRRSGTTRCASCRISRLDRRRKSATPPRGLADRVRNSFNPLVLERRARLSLRRRRTAGRDASIRPNQIHRAQPALHDARPNARRSALAVAERELLTPKGLRIARAIRPAVLRPLRRPTARARRASIIRAPSGRGSSATSSPRTSALTTTRRKRGRTPASGSSPCARSCSAAASVTSAEIYDGDAPHAGRGCCAQAWSVAEVLRATLEYAGIKSRSASIS